MNFSTALSVGGAVSRCVKAEKHDLGVIMADVKVLGSLESRFESTNRIYDTGGCSPTLSTMQGGNQEPKILEVKQLGYIENGTGKHQSNTIYSENGLSPSLTTIEGGGTQQIKVCESQIVAMRGRNPDNPSDRTTGSPTEQRLEINKQNISNCLTSVQKDNMLLVKQATKQGYTECEVGGVADLSFPSSATRRGRVQDNGKICPTIMSQNQELCRIESMYRIRKLTPRECGRLMGVSDEDINKMAAVNSNSQLYKQFGNSIVVDVMCHMFRNLNIKQNKEKQNE